MIFNWTPRYWLAVTPLSLILINTPFVTFQVSYRPKMFVYLFNQEGFFCFEFFPILPLPLLVHQTH